jgi:tRNA(Ile)-lysidine synthase
LFLFLFIRVHSWLKALCGSSQALLLTKPRHLPQCENVFVLQDRVLRTIARHAMFSTDHRVGVAVSGGSDSVCLLHLLHELAPRWNLRLSVVHIDHGIRGAASQADAEFVRSLAEQFALPFHLHRADVPSIDDNLEQAARRVRQEFYLELMRSGTADRIATGHTRSDQAETVLYRILRGSGFAGLAGIRPVTCEGIVRPLLDATRAQVAEWVAERRIEWREDESNQDRSFARNKIRHELLPHLRCMFNPQLDEALANLAVMAGDEEQYWEATLQKPVARGGVVLLNTSRDLNQPPAVARRLVRRAIENVKGDLRQIEFDHVEAVLEMARSGLGHGRMQIPGVDVFRSFEWIRFAPAGDDRQWGREFAVALAPPATVEIPGGAGRVDFQVVEAQGTSESTNAYDSLVGELDWQRIASIPAPSGAGQGLLELRNWRPGDQYRRAGQSHEQRIKLLFQEARVPLWERRNWPVLTANGAIIWSRRFGPAMDFTPDASTRAILRIRDEFPGDA